MFEIPVGKVLPTMPRITREYKRELITLMIRAFKTGRVTLNECKVSELSLFRHIDKGYVTGCNYYLSNYDFRTDTRGIFDESDSRFEMSRLESISHD